MNTNIKATQLNPRPQVSLFWLSTSPLESVGGAAFYSLLPNDLIADKQNNTTTGVCARLFNLQLTSLTRGEDPEPGSTRYFEAS